MSVIGVLAAIGASLWVFRPWEAMIAAADPAARAKAALDKSRAGLAAYGNWSASLTGNEITERVNGARVSANAFDIFGVRPAAGRLLNEGDDRADAAPVVVLSLAAMLLWLIVAEVFRLVYPAARRGRKVAYLTLASFVFLIIALASLMLLDNVHGDRGEATNQTIDRVTICVGMASHNI